MKSRSFILNLTSGLIAIAAICLFLHTEISRREVAEARRLAVESGAQETQRKEGGREPYKTSSASQTDEKRATALRARLRAAVLTADLLDRSRGWLSLIKDLQPGDFAPLLDAARDQFGGPGQPPYLNILEVWSHRDPIAALTYAGNDEITVFEVTRTWYGDDREAALRWARENSGLEAAQRIFESNVHDVERKDPRLALDAMGELNSENRKQTVGRIFSEEGDSAAAVLDWIGSLSGGAERDEAVAAVLPLMLRNDDPAATGLMIANPGALNDETLIACATSFKDPASAGQWLDSHGGEIPEDVRARIERRITARIATGR